MPDPLCKKPLFFILKCHSMTMTSILWELCMLHYWTCAINQQVASASINSEIKSVSHCLYLEDGFQDKSNKGAGVLGAVSSGRTLQEFSIICIKVPGKKNIWFWLVPVLICYLVIFCRPIWLILVVELYLSPHSFFIMSSTFLACSAGAIWVLPLAANLAAYISANCFKVKAQPWSPEPKPTVPMTGSI